MTLIFERGYKDRNPLSFLFWKFICDYLKEDVKSLSILHSIHELHDLSNYLYMNRITDLMPVMRSDCARYIDYQMEFYSKFINFNNDTIVIMGDHGTGLRGVETKAYQPFFGILNKNLTPGIYMGLFSYVNIFDLLYDLSIGKYDVTSYERSYVYCSEYPKYNFDIMSSELEQLKSNPQEYGVRSVTTDTDRYIHFFNGVESYYLRSDESENLINDKRYSSRISELKSKLKDIDICDVYSQKKFRESRRILLGINDNENGCEL